MAKMATAESKDVVEKIVEYCLTTIKGEHELDD